MSKTILVIDDDESVLEAVQVVLEIAGYTVETLANGGPLLKQKLAKSSPDLILLDVLLSGYDGRHIAKELKADKKTKSIPLIMMSAHPTAYQTSLEAGADAFVPKPFEISDFLKKVQEYL